MQPDAIGYRGVTYVATSDLKWRTTINHHGRAIEVGCYGTELEAAKGEGLRVDIDGCGVRHAC